MDTSLSHSSLLFTVLVLLAGASGWVLGRRRDRHKEARKSAERAKRYLKGLSYALSDQPDKAVDTFVELAKVDNDTVEVHFALGHLFRRRGETERAIRLHQNIIARPLLPIAHRAHASFELALDYMAAGILDRAETLLRELLDDPVYRHSCLKELLALYQQTGEWDQAAAIAEQLLPESNDDFAPALAHFYCQLAEEFLRQQRHQEALDKLRLARELDSKCVRASLIEARVQQALGDREAALASLRRIVEQDVALFGEALPLLAELTAGNAGLRRAELERALAAGAGTSTVLALSELWLEQEGAEATADKLIAQLRAHPTLRELQRLVQLYLPHARGSTREQVLLLADILRTLIDKLPPFRCRACGFHGRQLHWRCPTCKRWNSVRPVSGVEGE